MKSMKSRNRQITKTDSRIKYLNGPITGKEIEFAPNNFTTKKSSAHVGFPGKFCQT